MEPIIEIKHLSKAFGDHVVLKDIKDSVTVAGVPAKVVSQKTAMVNLSERLFIN